MEKSSWGWEEGRSTGGTGLATAQSTRPILGLSPRFEQGARARAWPYAHGRTVHNTRCRHSRLFLFYSSFIDFYIPLLCVVSLGWNIVSRGGGREEATGGGWGEGWGGSTEDGADVSVYSRSWSSLRLCSATDDIHSTKWSCCHSCEFLYLKSKCECGYGYMTLLSLLSMLIV